MPLHLARLIAFKNSSLWCHQIPHEDGGDTDTPLIAQILNIPPMEDLFWDANKWLTSFEQSVFIDWRQVQVTFHLRKCKTLACKTRRINCQAMDWSSLRKRRVKPIAHHHPSWLLVNCTPCLRLCSMLKDALPGRHSKSSNPKPPYKWNLQVPQWFIQVIQA